MQVQPREIRLLGVGPVGKGSDGSTGLQVLCQLVGLVSSNESLSSGLWVSLSPWKQKRDADPHAFVSDAPESALGSGCFLPELLHNWKTKRVMTNSENSFRDLTQRLSLL